MTLHRPYIRQEVREEVERRSEKNELGQYLDANTHKPIEGRYDLGHKAGHEYWREAAQAEKEGLTQGEFNDRMNDPDLYQIEDPHENRSHGHEMIVDGNSNGDCRQFQIDMKGERTVERNSFIESIRVDKATADRCDEITRKAPQNAHTQSGGNNWADDGGRERGDTGPASLGREPGNKGDLLYASSEGGRGESSSGHDSSGHGTEGHSSSGQNGLSGGKSVSGHYSCGHGGH